MTPSKLNSFIEPPIQSLKRSLPSTLIQSPIKRPKSNTRDSLFSPQKIKKPDSFDLIAPNISTIKHPSKRPRPRQSVKSRNPKDDPLSSWNRERGGKNNKDSRDDIDSGDFGDFGGFEERSPDRANDILD
jgi:hypothetical protein